MPARRVYDDERHAHFVTFSCYHRRRLLDHDRAKEIVVGRLATELAAQRGVCIGYVVMPDHVHSIVWFSERNRLSQFLKQWKQRSSVQIKSLLTGQLVNYAAKLELAQPIWQRKYYAFNLFSPDKIQQKLEYMHANPVRAGLAKRACDWRWSSARYYELQVPVDLPVRWLE